MNTTSPTTTSASSSGWFWFVTMAGVVIMQILFGLYVLPDIYLSVFENEILMEIGVAGSIISGIVGSILYNTKWSQGRYSGSYKWWEYVLSFLTAFGFTIGFGIAMGLAILVLYIVVYILIGAFIIGAIIGVLSGG